MRSPYVLQAYLGWEEVLQRQRSLKFKAQAVVKQMVQRSLAAAWRTWRTKTEEGADLRRRAALLVSSLQQRSARAAFNCWAFRVQKKRAAAELVQRALGGRAQRSLGACLAGWKAAAQEKRRHRQLVLQAVGRLTQRQLSTAFARWREVAGAKRHNRELLACAVQRLAGHRMGDVFIQWRQWAQQKHRLAEIEGKAVEARNRKQLARFVAAWQATAHKQAVARHCLAAIQLKQLRRSFSTWQAAAEDSKAAAAATQLAPLALQRWFARWRAAVVLMQQKRQRLEKAAAWAFGSSRQRAWAAWALQHQRQRRQRAAHQLFRAGMLRRCLAAWQEGVARKQRLLVKQQHLQHVAAGRRLATALHAWQRAARAHRFARRYYCARALEAWAENVAAIKVGGALVGLPAALHFPSAPTRERPIAAPSCMAVQCL